MRDKKGLLFLLVVVGNGFHEYDFRADIFCDLFDLEFPEMGCLNLEFPAGNGNDAVLGRLDALPDFLALTHVNLHGLFLFDCLIYQLVYADLYLFMVIGT
jgi:hypothetical protein